MSDPFAPQPVRNLEAAHAEALDVDAMRTRVLAMGGQLVPAAAQHADTYGLTATLATLAVDSWNADLYARFAYYVSGADPVRVLRFQERVRDGRYVPADLEPESRGSYLRWR